MWNDWNGESDEESKRNEYEKQKWKVEWLKTNKKYSDSGSLGMSHWNDEDDEYEKEKEKLEKMEKENDSWGGLFSGHWD